MSWKKTWQDQRQKRRKVCKEDLEIQDWLIRTENINLNFDKPIKAKEHLNAEIVTNPSKWKQSKLSFDNSNITFKDIIPTSYDQVGNMGQTDISLSNTTSPPTSVTSEAVIETLDNNQIITSGQDVSIVITEPLTQMTNKGKNFKNTDTVITRSYYDYHETYHSIGTYSSAEEREDI